MADNPIWERQPDTDTDKSWQAFQLYRDMGRSRSLQKAWEQYQDSDKRVAGYFAQWSTDNNWVARCEAYDAYQDEQRAKRLEQRRIAIEERSLDWYDRVSAGVEKLLSDSENLEWRGYPAHVVADLVALMQKVTDEGRRAVGLPHRVTESKIDANVTATVEMTWEDLMRRDTDDDDDSDD